MSQILSPLSIYPKEIKAYIHTRTQILIGSFICNSLKLETTQTSINKWIDKQIVGYPTVKYYLAMRRSELWKNLKTWMNLNVILLNEKNLIKKVHIHLQSILENTSYSVKKQINNSAQGW